MNHAEAYCHMDYQCDICRNTIRIWNSRDGVTPFGMCCIHHECNGVMRHTNWGNDVVDTRHKPGIGQYIWKDFECDEERANKLAVNRLAKTEGTEYELLPGSDAYSETVRGLTRTFLSEVRNGAPELHIVIDHEGNSRRVSEI